MNTKLRAVLLGGVLVASQSPAMAYATQFAQTPAAEKIPAHVQLPAQAMAGYYFSSNVHALKERRLSLPLPDGGTMNLQGRLRNSHPNGSTVWNGTVEGAADSSAIFSQHGKALAGVIRFNGRVFKVQRVADEIHMLMEVSPNEPFPEADPVAIDSFTVTDTAGNGSAVAADTASDDGSQIDVMVVYSTNTKERYGDFGGDVDGVNAHIALAIAESNQAYSNSQINTQLRLVHTSEVQNASGNMSADLSALTSSTDGVMDHIHDLRNQYGADMVSWFQESSQYCGIAWLSGTSASHGFSVVASNCATGYYSTAHELGHNMGSHHDSANSGGSSGIYPYSFGYQDPGEAFRTVMAYNCSGGCVRQQFFSNPDLTFNGLVTGTADADNARSINNTRTTVSQWRTAVVGLSPTSDFSYNCELLNCAFTDSSSSGELITQWSWDFGDGASSTLQNPTHVYSGAGSYDVQLTISDITGASSSIIQTLVVNETQPVPPTQPEVPFVTVNGTDVTLTWAASAGATHYTLERERLHPKNGKWTGATVLSGASSPYVEQPGEGTYRYRLTAYNEFGASDASLWADAPGVVSGGGSGGGGGTKGGGKGRNK